MPIITQPGVPWSSKTILWLLPAAFFYGLLSALCWPQTYTITHMVIDYHFGFGKRGLIGAILHHIDRPPYHYITLAWMAFAVFAIWLLPLVIAGWRHIRRDTGVAAAFLVFFLSAGFASLVCDVGRGEHFGLLMALPCQLAPMRTPWLLARACLLAAAVLIQEANYLIIAPVIAFDVWIGSHPGTRFGPVLRAAGTILPATLLTWYLGNFRTACDTAAATAYFQHMAMDFPIQAVPVATLCMDGHANIRLVYQALWSVGTKAALFPLAMSVALPSTVFNLALARRAMRGSVAGIAAAIVTSLAPIALLAVGADVVRFVTLIQVTSLLVLFSALRRIGIPPTGTLQPTPHRRLMITALIAFELGTGLTLNNGDDMLKFPFAPLVVRVVAMAEGQAQFVIIK